MEMNNYSGFRKTCVDISSDFSMFDDGLVTGYSYLVLAYQLESVPPKLSGICDFPVRCKHWAYVYTV